MSPRSVLISIFVLALTGCGTSASFDPSEEDDSLGAVSSELLVRQDRLVALADEVEARLAGEESFSGVAIDPEQDALLVYVKADALERTRAQLPAAQGLEVKPALLSKREADALSERIFADDAALRLAGVEVVSLGADSHGGRFEVRVKGELGQAERVLRERYPELWSTLVVQPGGDEPLNYGRFSDGPYHGGSRLRFTKGNQCTSAFGAKSSTRGEFLITAYHCVNPDMKVYNGVSAFVGSVTLTDRYNDAAFIRTDSMPYVFVEPLFSAAYLSQKVTASAHPKAGMRVCTSGSFSGKRCAGVVKGSYERLAYNSFTGVSYKVRVWYAINDVPSALTGAGDSGGPVLAPRGDGTWMALGLIHSGGDENYLVACPDGKDRKCSYRVNFTDIQAAAASYGMTLTGF